MSDLEADAQNSMTAEEPDFDLVADDTHIAQDSTEGSDEAIVDIESYNRVIEQMKRAPAEQPAPSNPEPEGEAPEAEDEDDEDGEPEKGAVKKTKYRFRPEGEVESLAFDIKKRAQQSNLKISLEEALTQAKTILGVDQPKAAEDPQADDADSGLPDNLDDAQQLLLSMRSQRRQAFAQDLNFGLAAELDEQMDALKDHISQLKQSAETAAQKEADAWQSAVNDSKGKAVQLYPDVTNANSPLVRRMTEIDAALKSSGNDLYYSSDKPLKLAQMAANELGIAPGRAAPAIASSQPSKRPVQPASLPMSGAARTTNATRQFDAELDEVNTEDDWDAFVKRYKL